MNNVLQLLSFFLFNTIHLPKLLPQQLGLENLVISAKISSNISVHGYPWMASLSRRVLLGSTIPR